MHDLEAVRLADDVEAEAWLDLYAAAPPALAAALGIEAVRSHGAVAFAARKIPLQLFNRVIGLGDAAPANLDDVDALTARYRGKMWIHVGPASQPAELPRWLEARGFKLALRPAWAKVLRGPEPPDPIATPFVIRELGPEERAAFGRTVAEAHGVPPQLAAWHEELVGRPGWRVYGALDGAALVAAGAMFLRGDTAWLGMGGTVRSHRRRGAQGALMVRRIVDAAAAGATALVTETGEPLAGETNPSLDNMFRCGFRRVCSRLNYEHG
jgi:hypothetical protein